MVQFGVMDPFVLYQTPYKNVRKKVENAVQTCQTDELSLFTPVS